MTIRIPTKSAIPPNSPEALAAVERVKKQMKRERLQARSLL